MLRKILQVKQNLHKVMTGHQTMKARAPQVMCKEFKLND